MCLPYPQLTFRIGIASCQFHTLSTCKRIDSCEATSVITGDNKSLFRAPSSIILRSQIWHLIPKLVLPLQSSFHVLSLTHILNISGHNRNFEFSSLNNAAVENSDCGWFWGRRHDHPIWGGYIHIQIIPTQRNQPSRHWNSQILRNCGVATSNQTSSWYQVVLYNRGETRAADELLGLLKGG